MSASLKQRLIRFAFEHRGLLKPLIPARRPVLVPLDGFSLYVRLDDWAVGARIAVRRRYEPHVSAVFARHLRPGAVVLDIGANIGFYSMLAARHVGPAGRVIAIEPSAISCDLIRRSAARNGFERVEVFECAASDLEEIVEFDADDSNGRISHEPTGAGWTQVQAVILDRKLAGEARIDLVKIDVEGAEARALRGMREILVRDHPILLTEFSPAGLRLASGVEPAGYLAFLRGLGYELHVIPEDGSAPRRANDPEILAAVRAEGTEHHLDLLALSRA